jgi:hypothetical protein
MNKKQTGLEPWQKYAFSVMAVLIVVLIVLIALGVG